jgi:DNA replication and repair protein RecF
VRLQRLLLWDFKNYEEASLRFEKSVVCFLGRNGSGKTNLLDAIHYLSFTKSAINPTDNQNIRFGQGQFMVKGVFEKTGKEHEAVCAYQQGKKTLMEDGVAVAKFSEHIGRYPVVLIAPQDIELIWNGSEIRRKFFDSILSQLDKVYLENLIIYTNNLKQRNSALKMFAEKGKTDRDLLASYDQKLVASGNIIFSKRKKLVEEFLPVFLRHYKYLSSEAETAQLVYKSELDGADLQTLFNQNISKDLALQRTTSGIHRDDFLFLINQNELSRFGSQGQQKSFLTSLKLTEFEILSNHKKFKPILLLDDIFDKLDDLRISRLMKMIKEGIFGQIFITDARQGQCKTILQAEGLDFQSFDIENGKFVG